MYTVEPKTVKEIPWSVVELSDPGTLGAVMPIPFAHAQSNPRVFANSNIFSFTNRIFNSYNLTMRLPPALSFVFDTLSQRVTDFYFTAAVKENLRKMQQP